MDNRGMIYSVVTGAIVLGLLTLNYAALSGKQAPTLGGTGYGALDNALLSRSLLDAKQAFVLTAARAAGENAIAELLRDASIAVNPDNALSEKLAVSFKRLSGLDVSFRVEELNGQAVDNIAVRLLDLPRRDRGVWISSAPIDIGGANVVVKISLPVDVYSLLRGAREREVLFSQAVSSIGNSMADEQIRAKVREFLPTASVEISTDDQVRRVSISYSYSLRDDWWRSNATGRAGPAQEFVLERSLSWVANL